MIIVEPPVSVQYYLFIQQCFVVTKNMLAGTIIVNDPDGTEFTRRHKVHKLKAYLTDTTKFSAGFHIGYRLEPGLSPKDNCHVLF
ncbi:MAG: hypothetical protein WCF07_10845 [Nitrososphaeraceae archaeon]